MDTLIVEQRVYIVHEKSLQKVATFYMGLPLSEFRTFNTQQ